MFNYLCHYGWNKRTKNGSKKEISVSKSLHRKETQSDNNDERTFAKMTQRFHYFIGNRIIFLIDKSEQKTTVVVE